MAKILVANQWGGGLGHIENLRPLLDALLAGGHQPVLALPNLPVCASYLQTVGYQFLQAPIGRGDILPPGASRSFATIMANQAFADPAILKVLADAWSGLLDLLRPDLVIADYAPLLCLAARGRAPLAVVGGSFTVPPGDSGSFPVLLPDAPDKFPEATVLEHANNWLAASNRPLLSALPAIHPAAHSFAWGLPEFDPYHLLRGERPSRPLPQTLLSPAPPASSGPKLSLFAYLSARQRGAMQLLVALAASGVEVEAHIRDQHPSIVANLRSRGVVVHEQPVPLATALQSAQAVLHHANPGLSTVALTLGRPQICLPMDLEKQIAATALETLGVAIQVRPADLVPAAGAGRSFNLGAVVQRVTAFCRDEQVQARAQVVAADVASRNYADPVPELVEHLESMLQPI